MTKISMFEGSSWLVSDRCGPNSAVVVSQIGSVNGSNSATMRERLCFEDVAMFAQHKGLTLGRGPAGLCRWLGPR